MKKVLLSVFVAVLAAGFVAPDVEARRLGGGTTSGMKRQTPPPQPAQPVPAKPADTAAPATPTTAATPAAAAAPKRSWLGPIAGLAAGLGLAALMSHLGLGAEFGSLLTTLLLVVVGFVAVRFLMRRFASGGVSRSPAMATANGMQFSGGPSASSSGPAFGSNAMAPQPSPEPAAAQQAGRGFPPGFDVAGFERIAKMIFIRMQAANDAGDLADLRQFATPEMFAVFKLDLQDRRGTHQQTDVVRLDAQVLEFVQEADRQIVSVRFHGLVREEQDAAASSFDETWHLTKPLDGSSEWAIAGIAQNEFA